MTRTRFRPVTVVTFRPAPCALGSQVDYSATVLFWRRRGLVGCGPAVPAAGRRGAFWAALGGHYFPDRNAGSHDDRPKGAADTRPHRGRLDTSSYDIRKNQAPRLRCFLRSTVRMGAIKEGPASPYSVQRRPSEVPPSQSTCGPFMPPQEAPDCVSQFQELTHSKR